MSDHPLLEVVAVSKHFPGQGGGTVRALDGISFPVIAGRTLGIVGESGCGKTTMSKIVLGLERPTGGSVRFEGRDIALLDRAGRKRFRCNVQAVSQDPFSSLNPRLRVGTIIGEPIVVNETCSSRDVRTRVAALLDVVGLPQRAIDRFPHEFSGGQRQRIAIARALALQARLIVLDEPVSALDVSIRAQILNLLVDLQQRLGLAYIFISHDLAAVAYMSHTIGVMHGGRIVEFGETDQVALAPAHPYTRAMFSTAQPSGPDDGGDEIILAGEPPTGPAAAAGCSFRPRCPSAFSACAEIDPVLRDLRHRLVACHLGDEVAA